MNVPGHIEEAVAAFRAYRQHINAIAEFFEVDTPETNVHYVTELSGRRWRLDDDHIRVENLGEFVTVSHGFRKDGMVAFVCDVKDFWDASKRREGLYILDEDKEIK